LKKNISNFDELREELIKIKSIDAFEFIVSSLNMPLENCFFFESTNNFDLYKYYDTKFIALINLKLVNNHRRINKFFQAVNYKLKDGGIYIGSVQTYDNRKNYLLSKFSKSVNPLIIIIDTLFHRVLPKLKFTKKMYFYLTQGKYRIISKAETFGRLYSCGFEILSEKEINNVLYFSFRKIKSPVFDNEPTYGPIVKLTRVGKNSNQFKVYKLRTMYPYSEFLQDYMHKYHGLDEGGKFKDDFRVSPYGSYCRKFWLDELPMIWNVIKGDMKLVGVRPISNSYFKLYTKELQEKRIKTKPGLLPPFYADMPKTLDEIQDSELKYLDAFNKNPFITDFKYLIKILKNIILKGERSK
jgi:lipopolysaccharide/colanic/teichoic acid biosynthesis glycosyltransferase